MHRSSILQETVYLNIDIPVSVNLRINNTILGIYEITNPCLWYIRNSYPSNTVYLSIQLQEPVYLHGQTKIRVYLKFSQCNSTGNMQKQYIGGIVGNNAGERGGQLYVTKCYSVGDIGGSSSGGIAGDQAGVEDGYVHIQECYSAGQISAGGGGIVGSNTADQEGEVHIIDCYTLGNIQGYKAGGIIGAEQVDTELQIRAPVLSAVYISGILTQQEVRN